MRGVSHVQGDGRGDEERQPCSRSWEGVRGVSHVSGDGWGVSHVHGDGKASVMFNVMGGM